MKAERWQQVEALFLQVLEQAPANRATFLAEACAGDDVLRNEVVALLESEDRADGFMERPAFEIAVRLLADRLEDDGAARELIGKTFAHYDVLDCLGSGGMGVVYKALDRRLKRFVALKILPEAFAADAERLERFGREARAASALNHPNVITIYEIGQVHRTPYIAMEFIEGRTLRQVMDEGLVPLTVMLRVAEQLAEGLARVHAVGVIHRDLKPENVMIDNDGATKILDFGLAKVDDATESPAAATTRPPSQSGTGLAGTASYMAPEQVLRQPVDFRADQFSLGCILYEIATGQSAFRRETTEKTLAAILEDPVAPITTVRRDAPRQFCQVLERCMAREPTRRYTSTQDMAQELRSIREKHFRSSPRRLRVAVTAALALAIALVVVIGLYLRPTTPVKIEWLAVVPLADVPGIKDGEILANGLTYELIEEIGQLSSLRVISWSTMAGYKGSNKSASEIATELSVDSILQTSMLRSGDRVELSVKLIRPAKGEIVWTRTYQLDRADILSVQREITRDVARALRIVLTPEQEEYLGRRKTPPSNFPDYYSGLKHFETRSVEGLVQSVDEFKQVIETDPQFAPAYAALANSYIALGWYSVLRPQDAYPPARVAANHALLLDKNLAEAHAALGRIFQHYDRKWDDAESELNLALARNPSSDRTLQWYSMFLMMSGRFDDAIAKIRTNIRLNPKSLFSKMILANICHYAGKYDCAIKETKDVLKVEPELGQALYTLAEVYEEAGRSKEAFDEWQAWARAGGFSEAKLSRLSGAYQRGGMNGYWTERLNMEIEEEAETGETWSYQMALLNARVGANEKALYWLERALDENHPRIISIGVDPVFKKLRSNPQFSERFIELKKKVRMPL